VSVEEAGRSSGVDAPPSADGDADQIAMLDARLADQIAAGEVVERPASVVKELVENSIDSGATRIDVELAAGGTESIVVVDDGRGIEPGQLELALRRHATSKLTKAEQLVEIGTMGFRGEALASIAAVARIRIRSRRSGHEGGRELLSIPGEPRRERPVAMAPGTQVLVEQLFASVPARRKFLRSESTEVGHCVDAVLRAALVHPEVAFSVRHGARELLHMRGGSQDDRVAQVLDRRGRGPYHRGARTHDSITVIAYLGDPARTKRRGTGPLFVVRRRVVRDRNLATMVREAYGDRLPQGVGPVACVFIDPPRGAVDVNVHPQKAEVRFAEPQRVYAAVRRGLAEAVATAPWSAAHYSVEPPSERLEEARGAMGRWEAARDGVTSTPAYAGASSSRSRTGGEGERPRDGGRAYSLSTRAASPGYGAHKASTKAEVDRVSAAADGRPEPRSPTPEARPQPQLVATLPGHVALFTFEGELWAVDLLELRGALLHHRLVDELGGGGVVAQGLLSPVTMTVSPDDAALVERSQPTLQRVGLGLQRFGLDAVVVRAVPAALPHCVEEEAVRTLVERVLPWLRLRDRDAESSDHEGAAVLARAPGRDPSARLARRWLEDARRRFGDDLPGVRRWSPRGLVDGDQER
jgi:DNA mismatch repair protein MutL